MSGETVRRFQTHCTLWGTPTSVPVETGPQWIIEMRDHYQKTGAYRADDLARVLGDPRDSVEIRGSGDVLGASDAALDAARGAP